MSSWSDVETVISTSFEHGIHVVFLYGNDTNEYVFDGFLHVFKGATEF